MPTLKLIACVMALLLATPGVGVAQDGPVGASLDPAKALTQYVLDSWTTDDGLPQNTVHAIAQTPDGYLWISTQEGLARFDGLDFRLFSKKSEPAFASNDILALLVDRQGSLWIGTNGGGLVRYRAGRFERFTTGEGLVNDHVGTLYEDPEGGLWIGTRGGLGYYDGTRFSSFGPEDGLAHAHVMSVHGDAHGTVWIGTLAGVSVYRDGRLSDDPRWTDEVILALFSDAHGGLWVSTETGLHRQRGRTTTTFSEEDGLTGVSGLSIYQNRAGTVWVGTEGGLHRFDGRRFEVLATDDGLNDEVVWSVFEDREGSLWFGTTSGGLHRLKDLKFTTLTHREGLPSDLTTALLEDADGNLWIGTDGSGVARYAPDGTVTTFTSADGLPDDYITALAATPDGALWVGTWSGGLTRYLDGRFDSFTTADGLPHDNVLVIYPDHDGALWIGTAEGAARYHEGRFEAFTAAQGLHNEVVWSLLRATDGTLWAGTQEGLHRYDDGRFVALTKDDGLASDYILSMHSDADGGLWLATWGGGLIRYYGGRFEALTTEHGLPSDNVFAIVEDDAGDLWLTGNLGIARVARAGLDGFFARGTPPAISLYDRADGLRSKECSGGSQPAAWKAQDGTLWFPTIKGLAGIHPAQIRRNDVPPPVVIEHVEDGDAAQLVPAGPLVLPPGHNKIALRYTGLSLLQPGENTFYYRLEGADEGWIEAGTRRTAYYTNLAPGAYHFRVRARNNDGVWSSREASLQIQIEPFFYQRTYFYLLVMMGLTVLGYVSYRIRVRQLRRRADALAVLVDERTRDIRIAKEKTEQAKAIIESQAEELRLLNEGLERQVEAEVGLRLAERAQYEASLLAAKERAEASARFKSTILDNMNHEFRTPLTAITSAMQILAGEVQGELMDFVEIVETNSRRLLRTLHGLLQLSEIDTQHHELSVEPLDLRGPTARLVEEFATRASDKALRLHVALPTEPALANADPQAFEHILHHLLDNALKFTDQGEVRVTLDQDGAMLRLTVADTGIGIEESFLPQAFDAFRQESEGLDRAYEGCGLGLTIARRLASMMQMELTLESRQGEGTTVRLSAPCAALKPGAQTSEDRPSVRGAGTTRHEHHRQP